MDKEIAAYHKLLHQAVQHEWKHGRFDFKKMRGFIRNSKKRPTPEDFEVLKSICL